MDKLLVGELRDKPKKGIPRDGVDRMDGRR
jgi:hypothetical protein